MIRSISAIRERTLARTLDMLEHLRSQVSMLPTSEPDVMRVLEKPQDLAVELTNAALAKFGHVTASSVSRFDKTRRAMNKLAPKRPRGEPRSRRIESPAVFPVDTATPEQAP
jgi:hypothetical protein